MNKARFAGHFYPAEYGSLIKAIENSFNSDFGPGSIPDFKMQDRKLLGIVVPHAGYEYSGAAAAWAYKELAESKFSGTYVIIAPDHNGTCSSVTTSKERWETPLGTVSTDTGFIKKLLEKCSFVKEGDIEEHAVEVQLPFLQYSTKEFKDELRIVPIIVPSSKNYLELGQAIAEINDDCCIIMSSDFTHYGPDYGYVPFTLKPKERIKEMDMKAINHILALDSERLLGYIRDAKMTACGAYAIATGMAALKDMACKHAELLKYYASGDITNDFKNSVSYASISFRE